MSTSARFPWLWKASSVSLISYCHAGRPVKTWPLMLKLSKHGFQPQSIMGFHAKLLGHVSCKKADAVINKPYGIRSKGILVVAPSKNLLKSWIRLCFLWENRFFVALRLEVRNSLPTNVKNSRPSLSTTHEDMLQELCSQSRWHWANIKGLPDHISYIINVWVCVLDWWTFEDRR